MRGAPSPHYLIERREVLAQTTRVHYYAGSSLGRRWMPEPAAAERLVWAAARKLSGELNRSSRQHGEWNVLYKVVDAHSAAWLAAHRAEEAARPFQGGAA